MARSERPRRKFDLEQHRARRRQHRRDNAWDATENMVEQHGRGPTPPVSRPPGGRLRGGYKRLSGRPGMLLAGAATVGGGAYLLHRRKKEREVTKLYDPFTGQQIEFGKYANDDRPSVGRVASAGLFGGGHALVAGQGAGGKTKSFLTEGAGAMAGGHLGRMSGGTKGAVVGSVAGGISGMIPAQRSGWLKKQPPEKLPTAKRFGKAVLPFNPASGTHVRSVSPMLPSGKHVSHENRLSVTHNSRSEPIGSALRMYRSGSKRTMTGGGKRFGMGATHVGKRLSTQQGAAVFAKRGTPMSDLHRQSRVGHRLIAI